MAGAQRRHTQGTPNVPDSLKDLRRDLADRVSHCRQRGHPRCLWPHQRAQPEQSAALFSFALARAGAGASRRHPRIRSRLQSDRAAGDAAVFGTRDPWRDLQGAAGRQRGVPSSRALDHAVRDFRHAARAGFSSRRRDGPPRAVLGQPRRIRRHEPAGREARGGRFARARLGQARHRAHAPPRRDRRRRRAARACVSHDLLGEECRTSATPRTCSGMCRR